MPHKYITRTKTNSIPKKVYTYDNSNSDISSDNNDSDSNYSDSNYSDSNYSDSNYDVSNCNGSRKFNKCDYYKFLNQLYPSHYSKNKYNAEVNKSNISENQHKKPKTTHIYNFDTLNNSKIIKKKQRKIYKKKLYNNTINESDDESDNESDNESDDESDEDSNDESIEDSTNYKNTLLTQGFKTLLHNIKKSDKNINVIVNLKEGKNKIYNTNTNSNDNPQLFYTNELEEYEDEEDDEDEEDGEDEEQCYNKSAIKTNKINEDKINKDNMETQEIISKDDAIPAPQKISNKNYKKFDKLVSSEEQEWEYFKNCLSTNSQLEAITKLKKLKDLTKIKKPYLLHLVDIDIPDHYKACALRKINTMRLMSGSGNSEYFKIKSWVDSFLKIPFNKYNNLPISFADGIEQCHEFMENAKKILDSVTYGLEDAKIQIMQMIGLWLVNPNAIGCAIAIKGPPGTGKTTLIKEGISKILNRPFALVALGGCGDSGFIDGFDYTYEGSKHGKIIDILIQCGCMNPVILFDELDKLSDSFKGQEITGVLTHLTDSTQNSKFSDKYFSEISIDMSKALFIFSYNDESAVNPILKDRMYKIETKGYKTKDKLIIAKDYLLPKIREEIKFDNDAIVFNDELLEYIINDFTEKEDGVRNLKRCLEIIYKKLNLYRLMKPNVNLFENSEGFKLKSKITWPCILTRQLIDDLINKASTKDIPYGMYN